MKIFTICLLLAAFINGCANKIEGTGNSIHNENIQSPNLDIPISGGFDIFGGSESYTASNLNIAYFEEQQ